MKRQSIKVSLVFFLTTVILTLHLTGCKEKKNNEFPFKGNAISQAIKLEAKQLTPDQLDRIPESYKAVVENGGTIEHITYKSKNYYGDGKEKEKKANVYLPIGYDGSKKYRVPKVDNAKVATTPILEKRMILFFFFIMKQ